MMENKTATLQKMMLILIRVQYVHATWMGGNILMKFLKSLAWMKIMYHRMVFTLSMIICM